MDRRGFLVRGFAPVALATLAGPSQGDIVVITPAHYLLFVDATVADTNFLQEAQLPEGCIINVIPLKLGGADIDEAIRLYKMEK
jgi:hypothetical protein